MLAATRLLSLRSSSSASDGKAVQFSWHVLNINIGRHASTMDIETPKMSSPRAMPSMKGEIARNKLETAKIADNDAQSECGSPLKAALNAKDSGIAPIRSNVKAGSVRCLC